MASQRVAVKLVRDAALVDFEYVSDSHLRPDLRPERRCHLLRRSEDRAFAGGQDSLEPSHCAFPISSVWIAVRLSAEVILLSCLTIAALTRCTVPDPTFSSRAVFRMPLPEASEERIAFSTFGSMRARPIGLPLLVPHCLALLMPARMRSRCRSRSCLASEAITAN